VAACLRLGERDAVQCAGRSVTHCVTDSRETKIRELVKRKEEAYVVCSDAFPLAERTSSVRLLSECSVVKRSGSQAQPFVTSGLQRVEYGAPYIAVFVLLYGRRWKSVDTAQLSYTANYRALSFDSVMPSISKSLQKVQYSYLRSCLSH
jgi:ribosomal protein L36